MCAKKKVNECLAHCSGEVFDQRKHQDSKIYFTEPVIGLLGQRSLKASANVETLGPALNGKDY